LDGYKFKAPVMEFSLFSATFQTHLFTIFKQAIGPGVLQTFSTCAVKYCINEVKKPIVDKIFKLIMQYSITYLFSAIFTIKGAPI